MTGPPSRRGPNKRGSGWLGQFDPNYKHGQEMHGDIRALLPQYEDAFGKLIADGTRNVLDLPAHYDLSPERYRIREDDTRVEIADSTRVVNGVASFDITCAAGEKTTLYTADRPRYVVGAESIGSWEFQLLDSLEQGDTVEIGLEDFRDNQNAAFFEFNGGTDPDRVVILSAGTEVASAELPEDRDWLLGNPLRPYIQFNWYRVGRFLFGMTYTDSSLPLTYRQQNEKLEELTVDTEPSTEDGNFHLYWSLDVGAGNSTKTLSAGSSAYFVLGAVTPTTRSKALRFTGLTITNSGEYEAVLALRVDPNRANVFVDVTNIDTVLEAGDGELLAISVPPTTTNADFTDPEGDGSLAGPRSPPQHNDNNSVIQYTKDVTTFPDQDGNTVTQSTDPGGYQIGFGASDATQSGAGRSQESLTRKRQLHGDNVCVILAKRDSGQSATLSAVVETEQDW